VVFVQHGMTRADTALVGARPIAGAPSSSLPRVTESTTVAQPPSQGATATVGERPVAARELALAGSTTSDLSDRELSALLKDIESLDAVLSTEVENATPMSPVSPKGSD
jgi:hypothetical protein